MLGAFRCSAVLLSRYPVKTSTNITGLEVVPNAQEVLQFLYQKTLKEISDGCSYFFFFFFARIFCLLLRCFVLLSSFYSLLLLFFCLFTFSLLFFFGQFL